MVPDGRWCSRTIVGPSGVARVVQLLEYGERLPVVAGRLDVFPSVVSHLWRSYQETGEYTRNRVNAFPDDNLKTRRVSYSVVSSQSHSYSSNPRNWLPQCYLNSLA